MSENSEVNRFSIIHENGVGENYISSDGFSLPKNEISQKDLRRLY
ncbi:MAG: hypothetical protein R6U17_04445 [Thermoplasmata archaeon]